MRKIITLTLVLLATVAQAQIMMTFGNKSYAVADMDSIVYCHVNVPSAVTLMDRNGEYSIFAEALRRTGLCDSILNHLRDKSYYMDNPTDRDNNTLYYPKVCRLGYTVFAEKDEVLRAAGINSFADLAAKCSEWYGNPTWFDYVKEKGVSISTGTDYENRWNVVNMFVAYHILKAKIAVDKLVYEKTDANQNIWNVCFGYEPQSYYETMLPGTLLKVWATNPNSQGKKPSLWVNRYVKNNTLTDQYGTFGSDQMHPLIYSGAKIDRSASIEGLNSFVHSIDKVLLYDQNARDSQHERIRMTQNQLLPELASNNIYGATGNQISNLNQGGNGDRVAFPQDYFGNLRCYSNNTILRYCTLGAWRACESSELLGWNIADYAIRLPHIPTGKYELRIIYPPIMRGGEHDFYIGNSSDTLTMTKVSTLDAALNPYESPVGYVDIPIDSPDEEISNEEKYGIESDKVMRQHGYMRAPASFSRGTYNTITSKLTVTPDDPFAACKQMIGARSCRTEPGYGTMMLRYIIGTVDLKQGGDYWLRIKISNRNSYNYIVADKDICWLFNFIELVPTDVADNDTYMEDWY